MALSLEERKRVLQALETLPPRQIAAVMDFIGYLKQKTSDPDVTDSLQLQQQSLERIWGDDEDDLYEL